MYLKEIGLECELGSSGSGQGPMADTCGQSDEFHKIWATY
jgi:hypothetical protein